MKRIFLIVLDSFGIGAMPDSEKFGVTKPSPLGRVPPQGAEEGGTAFKAQQRFGEKVFPSSDLA